jgi:hypothetical protein
VKIGANHRGLSRLLQHLLRRRLLWKMRTSTSTPMQKGSSGGLRNQLRSYATRRLPRVWVPDREAHVKTHPQPFCPCISDHCSQPHTPTAERQTEGQTGTIRSGIWTAFLRLQIKSIQRRSWKIFIMCKSCTIHAGTRMSPWSNTRVSNIYVSGSELRHQAPTSSCVYSSIAPR